MWVCVDVGWGGLLLLRSWQAKVRSSCCCFSFVCGTWTTHTLCATVGSSTKEKSSSEISHEDQDRHTDKKPLSFLLPLPRLLSSSPSPGNSHLQIFQYLITTWGDFIIYKKNPIIFSCTIYILASIKETVIEVWFHSDQSCVDKTLNNRSGLLLWKERRGSQSCLESGCSHL